ncbi:hypothetical protein HYH02_004129 [Chlamydomonas schloesseri]|uniref:20 kDa chaperonin, chloroplastic n=1 Tax=Chlamydomonas schloesseri TaxID=2026947 RepID=A0A835WRH1_9CHLO|nr:hypothetical protein HYH02_004129 [Chlamydomonas schloesseri]|eukprot:KAG2451531.1 hypothetical protein HYH02_004129 [Chlamydomonas schloesseri]
MQTCLSRRGVFGASGKASRKATVVRAEAISVPAPFTKVAPKGDRVLVKVAEEEVKTRGGILLPPSAIKKPTSGEVVQLGDGRVGNGEIRPFYLKPGQTVVYSKFGFMYQDLKLSNGEEYILIREDDVIGIMPRANAQADDVPELQPLADRVLIKVEEVADVTMGGVILPEAAKERPLSGTVVRVGPGKYDKDAEGKRRTVPLAPGDKVLYFKYAGDNMETPSGDKFVVLRSDDVLCKA